VRINNHFQFSKSETQDNNTNATIFFWDLLFKIIPVANRIPIIQKATLKTSTTPSSEVRNNKSKNKVAKVKQNSIKKVRLLAVSCG
jgi:hypothetical protein